MAQSKKLIIEWKNPTGSSQNQLVTGSLKTDILRPGVDALMVPPGKVWVITDVVKGNNVTIGGYVELLVNDEPVGTTDDVTRYDPANPSRPAEMVGVAFFGGSTIKANVYVNPNTGTTDATEQLIFYIEELDESEFYSKYGFM